MSLEISKPWYLDIEIIVSVWILKGVSTLMCLSNFRAIRQLSTYISRLWDFDRFGGKTPYCFANKALVSSKAHCLTLYFPTISLFRLPWWSRPSGDYEPVSTERRDPLYGGLRTLYQLKQTFLHDHGAYHWRPICALDERSSTHTGWCCFAIPMA